MINNNLNSATQFFKFKFNDFEKLNNIQNISNFQDYNFNNKKNYIAKNYGVTGSSNHQINDISDFNNDRHFFEIENSDIKNDENPQNKNSSNHDFYQKRYNKNQSYYNNHKTVFENPNYYKNKNIYSNATHWNKYQENQVLIENNNLNTQIYNNNGRFNDKFKNFEVNKIYQHNKNNYHNFNDAKNFGNKNYSKSYNCDFQGKNYYYKNKYNYEDRIFSDKSYKNNNNSKYKTKQLESAYDTFEKQNAEIIKINEEIKNNNSIDIQEMKKINEIRENDYLKTNYKELLNINQINKGLTEAVKNQPYPKFFIIKSFNEEDFHKVNL